MRARRWWSLLADGAAIGWAATQALDRVGIFLYRREDPRTRIAEDRARGGRHAYERAVDQMARRLGWRLDRRQVATWGWRLHKSFGLAGGIAYAVLRRQFPWIGIGRGLAFGAAFFLLGDEVMVPLAGLTPGPRAFSWKVHLRGALAHLAWAVAAESLARLFEAGPRRRMLAA